MITASDMLGLYGTEQVEPTLRRLHAGLWSASLIDGALRDIRYDGVEVIRAIAYLVRDKDWGTCRPEISDQRIDERDGGFRLSYSARCTNPDGHALRFEIAIDCDAEHGLECRATCTALTDFIAARCGFCVLHPIAGVAGAPARVEHGDGTVEVAHFPETIDPWQPFMDIRAIAYQTPMGWWVRCGLTGDVFEMEDQRNWSDASFKTYSRPLALPWPYTIRAGETSEQAVAVTIALPAHASAQSGQRNEQTDDAMVAVDIDALCSEEPMPELGIAVAPAEIEAVRANLDALLALAPRRLTLHFDPLAGHGAQELRRYAELRRASGIAATLELALPGQGAPAEEFARVAAQIREAKLDLAAVVVSPAVHRQSNPPGSASPPCPPLDEVYRAARHALPGLRLGGGMLSYFTELNRKRPPLRMVDFVTHATCPIVHAADDRSVMETLEAIPYITRSCRAFIGDQPYAIGPISIGMRQNPYGSRVMPNPHRERVAMAEADPRQRARYGAAWLGGYVAALAGARVECLTLGALVGPRGVMDVSGERYPMFDVAAIVARMARRPRVPCRSSRPGQVAAFGAVTDAGALELALVNLTPDIQRVSIGERTIATLDPFGLRSVALDTAGFADRAL
ncbi:hypothetical protein B0G57_106145 [Trinickia symbiotica]|uniref:Uncharacterized protein n=1 Tax=Trinickia symbiotica TaxID=863227 RepID=A0A2N7WZL0_9BURK|nr:hypothetical protein [Trinickia symbiotica]PMS34919.1 hypothetical protein C0Z20_21255 [Trinickia symbiotica]PPK45146.1 hypothetical protein B0G57_106145 [Trinickia symbiotica]